METFCSLMPQEDHCTMKDSKHIELPPPQVPTTPHKQGPSQDTHLGRLGPVQNSIQELQGTCLAEGLKPQPLLLFFSNLLGSKSAVDQLRPQPPVF